MDTTIIYIDNYLQQGIVHQLMSLGNLVEVHEECGGLAWRFGEPIKRAQAGDAAHRSAAASSNGFEVEEGRGPR